MRFVAGNFDGNAQNPDTFLIFRPRETIINLTSSNLVQIVFVFNREPKALTLELKSCRLPWLDGFFLSV
jgi:hypothetical protein